MIGNWARQRSKSTPLSILQGGVFFTCQMVTAETLLKTDMRRPENITILRIGDIEWIHTI